MDEELLRTLLIDVLREKTKTQLATVVGEVEAETSKQKGGGYLCSQNCLGCLGCGVLSGSKTRKLILSETI